MPRFVQFEVLSDDSGKLNFSTVLERQDWQPVTAELFTGGYTHHAHWLKLTLDAPMNQSLFLTVIMTVLDDVRLYVPNELVDVKVRIAPMTTDVLGWRYWQQGDLFPFNQRELDWRGFIFALHVPDTLPHTVYLRVVSTSTHLIFPQLWQVEQFVDYQKNERLLFGFFMGLALMCLLLTFISWLLTRKTLQYYYLSLAVAWIFHITTLNGFFQQWILTDYPEIASNFVGFAALHFQIAGICWIRELLLGQQRQSWAYRLHSMIMLFGLLAMGFTIAGSYGVIVGIFGLTILTWLAVDLILVLRMWLKKTLPTHLFLIYSLILLDNFIPVACLSGYVTASSSEFIYFAQIATFINFLILFMVTLNDAYQTIRTNQQIIDIAALQAEASQSQRYWLAMLTHEIKTPLSVINASCQSMELLHVESEIQKRIDKIKRNVARIDDLVKRFLRNDEVLARLKHLDRTSLDLNRWLSAQLQLFDEIAQKRWHLKIQSGLVIDADANLLAIALNNLLTNALKYSQANSVIEISVECSERQNKSGILFSVQDYGLPIEEQKRDYLFSRYQLSEYVGNGVGLWACREITRAHAGEVWLHDTRLDGNTFNVWLPKKEKPNA